jgi:hypothetical protein
MPSPSRPPVQDDKIKQLKKKIIDDDHDDDDDDYNIKKLKKEREEEMLKKKREEEMLKKKGDNLKGKSPVALFLMDYLEVLQSSEIKDDVWTKLVLTDVCPFCNLPLGDVKRNNRDNNRTVVRIIIFVLFSYYFRIIILECNFYNRL